MPTTVTSNQPFEFVLGRDFNINGPALVTVVGGVHMSGRAIGLTERVNAITGRTIRAWELGLAVGDVTIDPRFVHGEVFCDDMGNEVPVDVFTKVADCTIKMRLIHHDWKVLNICMSESMGGRMNIGASMASGVNLNPNFPFGLAQGAILAGTFPKPGVLLGGAKLILASGNHFITVSVMSPTLQFGYRFPACYLTERPVVTPLGTRASIVDVTFRAIPYVTPPILSGGSTSGSPTTVAWGSGLVTSGYMLWDNNPIL